MADCRASAGASASGDYAAVATSELVARANLGDQAAWDQPVDRYGGIVWAVARAQGLGPDDAADVSHVTWLLLTQHLGWLGQPERLGSGCSGPPRARRTACAGSAATRFPSSASAIWRDPAPRACWGRHVTLGSGTNSPRQRTSAAEVVARS